MVGSGAMQGSLGVAERSADREAMMGVIGTSGRRASIAAPSTDVDLLLQKLYSAPPAQRRMEAQAWGFVVVQGRERVLRYTDRAKTFLLSGRPDTEAERCVSDVLESESFHVYFDVGTLVAICAPNGDGYAEADCWLAARNLELAAFACGMGACCTGFAVPLLRRPEVRDELGIPEGLTCFAALMVGVARAMPPSVPRPRPVVLSWVR